MNPEVKAKWLEALRSGKYKQGKGKLRDGDKFCCLGVLCEISGMEYKPNGYFLPEWVQQYAGLHEESPIAGGDNLANFNDGKGYGFKRIANLIEKYL